MWTFLWKHVPNGYGLESKRKWTHSKLKLEKVKANVLPSLQNGFTLSHNKIFLPTGQTFVAHLFWEEVFFWGWVGDYSTCSKLWSLENFHTCSPSIVILGPTNLVTWKSWTWKSWTWKWSCHGCHRVASFSILARDEFNPCKGWLV